MKGFRITVHGRQFDIAMPQGGFGIVANLNQWRNEININGATYK